MLARGLIGAAILAYLLVLGCVLIPTSATASKKTAADNGSSNSANVGTRFLDGLPYRGAGMQIQRVDWIDKYKASIDEIAALGFDTVSLVIDTRMENGSTSLVWLDMRKTPTPEKLADLIQHAKSKKLRVILMPIVLLDKPIENEWRGTIKPANWDDWFDSYREMLIHFAWIAEQNKVDVLSIGSELVSAEKERDQWKRTINAVRGVFNGQLTYSANWDHYKSIPFWNELDLIGMNSYWSLDEDPPGSRNHMKEKVTVEKVVENWQYIQEDLLAFQKQMNKPILFLEVGWCSMSNAAHEPWDYTRTDDYAVDKELQRKMYEGFFKAWYDKPGLGGFMCWEWTPGDVGDDDKGYTPEDKPAQDVLKEWLAKPWKNYSAPAK